MESYLTKQQRSEEKAKDTIGPLFVLFIVMVLFAALGTGCASTLDTQANLCMSQGRDVEYTTNVDFRKFSCSGNSISATVARR